MTCTTSKEAIREALHKDDLEYINTQIEREMQSADASLCVAVGFSSRQIKEMFASDTEKQEQVCSLVDSYVIEYVRNKMDLVDNERILTILSSQIECFISSKKDEVIENASN